jgi:hypothetical protein
MQVLAFSGVSSTYCSASGYGSFFGTPEIFAESIFISF